MNSPAASAPVVVLVLAWDETTPAVRALLEATEAAEPALDPIGVLVPTSPTSDEFTQEEFLPLADNLLAEEVAPPAVISGEHPTPLAQAPALTSEAAPAGAPAFSPQPAAPVDVPALPATVTRPLPEPATVGQAGLAALTAAAPDGPAVRVLHLPEASLAALATYARQTLPPPAWLRPINRPAAPYIGSSVADEISVVQPVISATDLAAGPTPMPPTVRPLPKRTEPVPARAAAGYLPTEAPAAPDAELDTAPTLEVNQLAFSASASTTELSEEAANELDASSKVEVGPVQTGQPEAPTEAEQAAAALAPLPEAAAEEAPAAPATSAASAPAQAALLPGASQFDAPDLNFQVIQYARFAVPLALAAQPFAVIYAPAWPTWLAAQELRQRTSRPLVLHLATLAAADEPLDLAAGWPAEIQRQALHRADLILTETLALAYRLRRELDLPAHRVRPVPAADAAAIAHALSTAQLW